MVRAQNFNFPRKSCHCVLKLTLWLGILLTSLLERVRRQRARPESRYTLGENTEKWPNIYVRTLNSLICKGGVFLILFEKIFLTPQFFTYINGNNVPNSTFISC